MAFLDQNRRLRDEKQRKFLGTASIRFEALDFSLCQHQKPLGGGPDKENVDSLENLFRRGCGWSPDQISHQIPALIDPAKLSEALQFAGIPDERLKRAGGDFVELNFAPGVCVHCLKGQHRVLAADATVTNRNKRWIVRLYAADLSHEARNDLADEQSNERQITDAEFFYRMTLHWLRHDSESDPVSVNKWFALLGRKSESKARDARRLWFGPTSYRDVFKPFHEIPALFWGLSIGSTSKIISMPKRQTKNQIKRVFEFWDDVCQHDADKKMRLDMNTIKQISGKAPGASSAHREELAENGEILSNFNAEERRTILDRLQLATRDRSAPTLKIFYGNVVYLQKVVDCLRNLVRADCKPRDLWQDLNQGFEEREGGLCLLQVSENRCKLVEAEGTDQFELACRQLWLFALREYPSIPRETKQQRAGPKSRTDQEKLFKLAVLAHKLGCRSEQISDILATACWKPSSTQSNDVSDPDYDTKPYLCGRPHPGDLDLYKGSLFLSNFHKPFDPNSPGSSFFFIQRSLYFDMFPDHPQGIDVLMNRAAVVGEHDLVDDTYRPRIQDNNEDLLKTRDQLLAQISELQQRIKEDTMQREELDSQLREIEIGGYQMERSKEELSEKIEAQKLNYNNLCSDYQALALKSTAEAEHLNRIKMEVETESAHLTELQKQAADVRGQLVTLDNDKNTLESKILELRGQANQLVSSSAPGRLLANRAQHETIKEQSQQTKNLETQYEQPNTQQDGPVATGSEQAVLAATSQIFDYEQSQMTFLVELRRRTRIVKTERRLEEWLDMFRVNGYSMVDNHEKTLVPHSCFKALKNEKEEENRLIVLFKDRFIYGENDFLEKNSFDTRPRKRAKLQESTGGDK
ncbi:uncharacterized protein NECHADRAFT_88478 [Fusarium vanettenii 77-13-4]|uniref:Uncharacterized protein n=1 Tax=Fusarium vanettenii (strain ATCC MYA-4622 / CBS 123669 / FGSC 9596 / NRRL 45880 / 77-13-4) TaxID=660122 RepID=C7ZBP0_FUSV7|nr:uncharacterized protein NECHADRAFT_88478 [Fusarium vanettenii 77-13-4]EEU38548.1 hypothetical protein NECHADRAFT_88478 [Fusarium vanettenii 77-13-4]